MGRSSVGRDQTAGIVARNSTGVILDCGQLGFVRYGRVCLFICHFRSSHLGCVDGNDRAGVVCGGGACRTGESGLAGAELVENASDAQAVAFALLLHLVNLLLYISMGLIGLWVQNVSLGEVTQSAQKLRTRQENKP
jgi:hypothetical protein